jgi:hypothetical protein
VQWNYSPWRLRANKILLVNILNPLMIEFLMQRQLLLPGVRKENKIEHWMNLVDLCQWKPALVNLFGVVLLMVWLLIVWLMMVVMRKKKLD